MRNLEPDDLGLVTPANRKILFHSSHRIPEISNRNIWSNGKRPLSLFWLKNVLVDHVNENTILARQMMTVRLWQCLTLHSLSRYGKMNKLSKKKMKNTSHRVDQISDET